MSKLVKYMPHLQHIKFKSNDCIASSLLIAHIVQNLKFGRLRTLEIDGMSTRPEPVIPREDLENKPKEVSNPLSFFT